MFSSSSQLLLSTYEGPKNAPGLVATTSKPIIRKSLFGRWFKKALEDEVEVALDDGHPPLGDECPRLCRSNAKLKKKVKVKTAVQHEQQGLPIWQDSGSGILPVASVSVTDFGHSNDWPVQPPLRQFKSWDDGVDDETIFCVAPRAKPREASVSHLQQKPSFESRNHMPGSWPHASRPDHMPRQFSRRGLSDFRSGGDVSAAQFSHKDVPEWRQEDGPPRRANLVSKGKPSTSTIFYASGTSEREDHDGARSLAHLTSPFDSAIVLGQTECTLRVKGSKGKQPVSSSPRRLVDATMPVTVNSEFRSKETSTGERKLDHRIKQKSREWLDEQLALTLQNQFVQAEKVEEARRQRRECTVCNDAKDPLDYPIMAPTQSCTHAVSICTLCLQTWITSEVQSKGVTAIKCPECPQTLSHNDVRRAATAQTFAAYDKLATRLVLSALPDFAWCLGPHCDSGQLNADNDDNFMECVECGFKQCLKHGVQWHTRETCDQYDDRVSGRRSKREEDATARMIDEVSKLCPGKHCGWRIQKIDGCDQ